MKYKINKKQEGRWKFYEVVDEQGNVLKEFDDYNYQRPFHQAQEFIKELNEK
jgi:ribosomal protein S6